MLDPGIFVLPGPILVYTAKSATFAVALANRATFFDNTGTYAITLGAAATLGAGFTFYSRCVSGTQTITPNGAELINGAATYAVSNAGDIVMCVCTGTGWDVQHVQLPSAVAITGGTINGTTIGISSAVAGNFTSIGATTRGTILATTIGANGQITSTLATGTAPLVIASTTVVANLNVSQLLGATWTAPGVIGSVTPAAGNFTTIGASTRGTIAATTGDFNSTLTAAGLVTFTNATDATTTSSGALVITGGLGIAKALWVGGLINITGVSTFQNNVNLSSAGANPALSIDDGTAGGGNGRSLFFKNTGAGSKFNFLLGAQTNADNVLTFAASSAAGGSTYSKIIVHLPAVGGVVIGGAALATNATDGFLYIPSCAGAPTGVPTAWTGTVAIVYDTTNNKFYVYNGAWKGGTTPGLWT